MPWVWVRVLCAAFLLWFAWFTRPRETTVNNRAPVKRIACISHDCILWGERRYGERRNLTDDEIEALVAVHTLMHRKTTLRDILGNQENEE